MPKIPIVEIIDRVLGLENVTDVSQLTDEQYQLVADEINKLHAVSK